MPRITRIAILSYLISLEFAVGTFLNAHGGLQGDLDDPIFELDYHPRDEENVLFNRWYVTPVINEYSDEPRGVRFFVAANLPAYYIGGVVYGFLRMIPSFREHPPFGYSDLSYRVLFMLMLSPFQWFFAGELLARFLLRLGWKSEWTYVEPLSAAPPG